MMHETVVYREIVKHNHSSRGSGGAVRQKSNYVVSILISHDLSFQLAEQLLQQLPPPILIAGDLNAYNTLWGCHETLARGKMVEEFIRKNALNVMKDGTPTRIASTSETAVDVSLCSPDLESHLQWSVYPTCRDSDHNSVISISKKSLERPGEIRNFERADWQAYKRDLI